ncbi:MAG: hypothetical protein OXE41_04515 [Gammaproteobacteria bacterium]|nr:hypothetical protein [Gammaproteobacteria bacterium]MCY4274644.1 hypothetical protein [Gammaproteobacteria bacterium]
MNKLLTVAGCFTFISTLVLFPPQKAQGIGDGVNDAYNNLPPVVPYVEPTSVQRRNQLCIEEWRKSHAFTKQECKGMWVSWDSYTLNPSYFNNVSNEAHHMKYSRCLVNVECRKGLSVSTLRAGEHNAVLVYGDVKKLRRCKENSGQTMNTHCAPLTDADIEAAIEEYDEYWENQSQQSSGWGGYYSGWGY